MSDIPTRLRHQSAQLDINGNLRVVLAWDRTDWHSPCMVREVVRYTQRDPIFVWDPPNPTINTPYVPGWAGQAPDIHVLPARRTPPQAGRWVASQHYEYTLDDHEWIRFGPTYTIEREIYQAGSSWMYRIRKRSSDYEGNFRQFFQEYNFALYQP